MIRRSLATLAAFALLAACNKLDHGAIEQMATQEMSKKAPPIKSVSCPEGRDFKEDTFDCAGVDSSGKPLTFKVTVRPTSGGKADIRFVTMIDGKQYSN